MAGVGGEVRGHGRAGRTCRIRRPLPLETQELVEGSSWGAGEGREAAGQWL